MSDHRGVSVIIPTLNRSSIAKCLDSVLVQPAAREILIVDDSQTQDLQPPSASSRVRVLRTGGRAGAAAARNLGLQNATCDFIAFLDDDDEWFDDHLARALRVLSDQPRYDIYCARALVRYANGPARLEPVSLLGDRTFWDYTFGLSSCWARGRRIITPTLVFRSVLRTHLMEPDLVWAEDTWWLLTAEQLGHRIVQDDRVGAIVHASGDRRRDRELDNANLEWAARVEDHRPGGGAMHLVGLGRTAAKEGKAGEVLRRAKEAASLPMSARVMPIFAVELGLSAAVATVNRARRLLRLGQRSKRP